MAKKASRSDQAEQSGLERPAFDVESLAAQIYIRRMIQRPNYVRKDLAVEAFDAAEAFASVAAERNQPGE